MDDADTDLHLDFCMQLEEMLLDRQFVDEDVIDAEDEQPFQMLSGGQVVMKPLNIHKPEVIDAATVGLERIHEWNCAQVDSPYMTLDILDSSEPNAAVGLLQFMVAATPDDDLREDILNHFQEYANDIVGMTLPSFVGNDVIWLTTLDNVPGTVNTVKYKLAYVQVPQGESNVLKLVNRVRHTLSYLSSCPQLYLLV
jgi:hypothetical protein